MSSFNTYPSNRKPNSKVELLRGLSDMVEIEVNPKSWFKRRFTIKIWFTPSRIVDIETKNKIDLPFKSKDSVEEIWKWANENNYEIVRIKRRKISN